MSNPRATPENRPPGPLARRAVPRHPAMSRCPPGRPSCSSATLARPPAANGGITAFSRVPSGSLPSTHGKAWARSRRTASRVSPPPSGGRADRRAAATDPAVGRAPVSASRSRTASTSAAVRSVSPSGRSGADRDSPGPITTGTTGTGPAEPRVARLGRPRTRPAATDSRCSPASSRPSTAPPAPAGPGTASADVGSFAAARRLDSCPPPPRGQKFLSPCRLTPWTPSPARCLYRPMWSSHPV